MIQVKILGSWGPGESRGAGIRLGMWSVYPGDSLCHLHTLWGPAGSENGPLQPLDFPVLPFKNSLTRTQSPGTKNGGEMWLSQSSLTQPYREGSLLVNYCSPVGSVASTAPARKEGSQFRSKQNQQQPDSRITVRMATLDFKALTAPVGILRILEMLTASMLYSIFFTCASCGRQIAACVLSFLTFILYAVEVGLTRAKPGEISGFLSTVPGLLKVLEAFVACVIFICLYFINYTLYPGLQWCVAVYSICFIFSLLIILLTIGRLLSRFPAPFNKVLIVCNVLAVLMYITAAVIWPFYCFRNNPRPSNCQVRCAWNLLAVISFMTFFNLIAYIVDTVYSFKLVLFTTET
ncbi:hypothetical protein CRENBAI_007821 [Crenichthys baileyi]|uniref:MARVEL domain-containing protein n=1 Tax=Crenichthys baileyi TaxID=28760 RepID=A0AAV9SMA5_9TELE